MRHPTNLNCGDFDWAKARLMVFSQDEGFCFLVRQTFRKLNIRDVLLAANQGEAEKALAQAPDAALVDMDGDNAAALAFIRQARALPDHLPVLIVARPANRGRVAQADPLGNGGYLPKPVSAHEVALRVAELIRTPRQIPPVVRPAAPAPPRPSTISGGTLVMDDQPPPPPRKSGNYGDDTPPPAKPRIIEAAPTPAAEKPARTDWCDALAVPDPTPPAPAPSSGPDLSAVVAAHGRWLASKGTDGERADLKGTDIAGCDLAGAVLSNAAMRDTDLSDAHLAEARLDGVDFRHATLAAANLSGAHLAVAQLRHANLEGANLEGACLRGADLSGARLRGAKLAGADFTGATLVGTDLGETDLSKAENLTRTQIDKARCGEGTTLPPGLGRTAEPLD